MRKPKDKNNREKVNRLDVCGMKRWKERMRLVVEVELEGGRERKAKKEEKQRRKGHRMVGGTIIREGGSGLLRSREG